MNDEQRRRELTDFLKTRRARIAPEEVGFPNGTRRRTPGLRREEVAQLANVSTTWYTFLEQGRDIRVSAQVLESIASALQLTSAERVHLFMLALGQPPTDSAPQQETVSPALQRLLDSFDTGPAYITGRRWDILAWNQAACVLFGDLDAMSMRDRNIVWFFFTDEEHRRRLVDWERHAQLMLAKFRCTCSRYVGDEKLTELIEDLQRVSPEFRHWWTRHDIRGGTEGLKEYDHPVVGRLMLEYTIFLVEGTPDLRFVAYTPLPGSDSLEKFEKLKVLHQQRLVNLTNY